MATMTRENLRGVWAAVATPFDRDDRFDEGVLRENLRRLAGAGVHGAYTTDSDGEFYAIELDEFRTIVDAFADECERLGLPSQVGVTWSNTKGVVDRVRHALDRGIQGAHVGHPFFMPMTPGSLARFWDDVQEAVPESFALIHYNTRRCPNYLLAADYAELAARIPSLVGTKHTSSDFHEFSTLTRTVPELAHFVGEHVFTPFALFGARGIYSWFVNFNARYMVDWYDDIAAGRWEAAVHRQDRMTAFIRELMSTLGGPGEGNLHAIVGKAVTASSSFLVPANNTRRPYLAIDDALIETFRVRVRESFADLLPDS
jgi:dihydrodipicolinate synthase/N-acetylneuraminate lyase